MKKTIQSFFIMSLKNKTFYIFFCLSIIVFLLLGIWRYSELNKHRKWVLAIEDRLAVSDYNRIEHLKMYPLIYTDFFYNKVSILEMIGNKTSVMVYRFSKYMCSSCIHEDLQEIELIQKEFGKDKIILLPAYPDDRAGRFELSNLLAKYNYVNIPIESFLIPLREDGEMQRYFAVIDKEGNLTMVYFPQRSDTNSIRLYFEEVKRMIID